MTTKKLFLTIGALLLVTLVRPSAIRAASANLYISPSSQTIGVNCTTTVDVMLDTGGQETTGVDVIINFDSSKLTATNVAKGSLYSSYETTDFSIPGKVVIQARALANETFMTTAGSGQKLATITFSSKAVGSVSLTFKYLGQGDTTDTNVINTSGADILGSSVPTSTINVQDGASCPGGSSPTATPTSSSSNPAPTTYSAPVSGSASQTLVLISLGGVFTILAAAFLKLNQG
jgi:hypothetical protein